MINVNKMFSKLFGKKKKENSKAEAFNEAANKIGTADESLIDMAIISISMDPQQGSLHLLNATSKENLFIPSMNDNFSGACITDPPDEDCVYIAAHSSKDRCVKFTQENQEFSHCVEVSFMTLLFESQEKVGIILNPDDEYINLPIAPKNMELFRNLVRASFKLTEGSYYFTRSGDVDIVKVLKIDDGGIHLSLFSNSYKTAPTKLDVEELSFSADDRSGNSGIGHIPITLDKFFAWSPTQIQEGQVLESELEGYNMWLEAKGGYF